ncbi:MAG: ABC transporter ATP-binding protein [Christensenellales bacterium]
MIEVKNLVKKYGQLTAVDNISFSVPEGQIYGFLGPNGAGKSTTMNIITGYLAATEGQAFIDGHDIFEEPEEAKKCIGYLPEFPPLYTEMTPMEYLMFAAGIKGIEKSRRMQLVQEVIETTRIDDVKNRLIRHLSKGYCQRVGLAQALLGFPKVLILDEPTVGLDPKQIIEMRDLIKSLGKKHTVILSSHILSEVSAVCDTVMIISQGKLVAIDTPENLQKKMEQNNHLQLTVKGSEQDVKAALVSIKNILSTDVKSSPEKGAVCVTVESPKNADLREQVFYALSAAKCPILSMASTTMSLEDVFLELTSSDTGLSTAEKTPKGGQKQ